MNPQGPSDTRRRILDTARQLFNQRGLHRVGVRELARELHMTPGNLSYHFPTKDDLIVALMEELRETNRTTAFASPPERFDLATLYGGAIAAMRNMLDYRFALLSYVDAVMASPALQHAEVEFAAARASRTRRMLELLVRSGELREDCLPRAPRLHEQGEFISSGWLRAAALRPDLADDRAAILHYAKLGCALVEPFCTREGEAAMNAILDGRLDDQAWNSRP